MNYHEFQNQVLRMIRRRIAQGWLQAASAVTELMTKNNGMEVCGLFIRKEGETMSPAIYLEAYYELFLAGQDLDWIVDRICLHYEEACSKLPRDLVSPENFEDVKPFIIYRIVNLDRNRDLLRSCPCIPLLDLAVTFRWLVLSDENSISSAMITNFQMDFWKVGVADLLELARVNTSRLFPVEIRPMEDMIRQLCTEEEEDSDWTETASCSSWGQPEPASDFPMFIMTNRKGINGATCLIYEDVLKNFAEKLREGFYILPSSVHELILIPESWIQDPSDLGAMVKEVNEAVVADDEILSDSVYHFNREKNSLELAVCA